PDGGAAAQPGDDRVRPRSRRGGSARDGVPSLPRPQHRDRGHPPADAERGPPLEGTSVPGGRGDDSRLFEVGTPAPDANVARRLPERGCAAGDPAAVLAPERTGRKGGGADASTVPAAVDDPGCARRERAG